jgi:uncharacterized protein YbjT (DUF2867 family)
VPDPATVAARQPTCRSDQRWRGDEDNDVVVFLTGASGFVGRHLLLALRAGGHRVIAATHRRSATVADVQPVDFTRDFEPGVWRPRLVGVDAVINAVGIFRERGNTTFDAVHARAPRALFAAAAEAGVKRVVQISALGADEEAMTPYHVSKRRADDFLASMPVSSATVQPSLIYGIDGASSRVFNALAALPWIPLPAGGHQRVQPIHIDDAVAALVALLERDAWRVGRVALVGPEPLALRDYLLLLRAAMGLPRPRTVSIPRAWVAAGARIGDHLPALLIDRAALAMLERGNVADPGATQQLLGHMPRRATEFIAPSERRLVAADARLAWLLPLLRWSVAAMWIVTGIVSLAVYPVADSYALLARAGIRGTLAPVALAGAAVLDIVLGVASLAVRRRFVWWAQIALIVVYTGVITWRLPEYWAHPYGPVLKNVPIVAALLLLAHFEER